jgi:hypothetical protein
VEVASTAPIRCTWQPDGPPDPTTGGPVRFSRAFVDPVESRPGRPPVLVVPRPFRRLNRAARRRVRLRARVGAPGAIWLDATAGAHEAYRAAHGRHAAAALAEHGVAVLGGADPRIEVICVTSRARFLGDLAACFAAQSYADARLTIVINSTDFDEAVVRDALGDVDATVVTMTDSSLGHCLNEAIDRSSADVVAKWDDDDLYGPHFLGDLVIAARSARSAVTGKHSYYAHLADRDQTILRHPGQEFRFTSFVGGGTMLIDRTRIGTIRFADRSLGEDRQLLQDCEEHGLLVFAADRFNYVQRRWGGNTWQATSDDLARGAVAVGRGVRRDTVFR